MSAKEEKSLSPSGAFNQIFLQSQMSLQDIEDIVINVSFRYFNISDQVVLVLQKQPVEFEEVVHVKEDPALIRSVPLTQLTREGDEESIRKLLANGDISNIDKVDENKVSALHYAARQNSLSILKLLLDNGANVNNPAAGGLTPLHFAARFKINHNLGSSLESTYQSSEEDENEDQFDPTIHMLVQYGADINKKDRYCHFFSQ